MRRPGGGRKRVADKDPTLVLDLERLVDADSRGDPELPLRWTAKSVRRLAQALKEQGHTISHETVAKFLRARLQTTGERQGQGGLTSAGPSPTASTTSLGTRAGSRWGSTTTPLEFAVAAIRGWWDTLGEARYPEATSLTITADCGGSNGYRTRLWKTELQKLADDTGLTVTVCHFPPGTSKWNKIEHRLFSFITRNRRGKPLVSHEVIINLIGATTTRTGLEVYAQLDDRHYPKGLKVSDAELAAVNLMGDELHPDWNYTIAPR